MLHFLPNTVIDIPLLLGRLSLLISLLAKAWGFTVHTESVSGPGMLGTFLLICPECIHLTLGPRSLSYVFTFLKIPSSIKPTKYKAKQNQLRTRTAQCNMALYTASQRARRTKVSGPKDNSSKIQAPSYFKTELYFTLVKLCKGTKSS